jgi:anti-anti-sigma factor
MVRDQEDEMRKSPRNAPIDQRRLDLSGELDIATGTDFALACATDEVEDLCVDISALTFMDCSGYRNVVAARLAHEARGGSVALRSATGQPKSLLRMIEELGRKSA